MHERIQKAARVAGRRGNAAMISVMTMMLLGFGALAVDIGSARVVRAELQSAADAASHGAVAYLQQTPKGFAQDMSVARAKAVALAGMNYADGKKVTIDPNYTNAAGGGVVLGYYDRDTHAFVPSLDSTKVNAVQVNARLDNVATIFGKAAFGRSTLGAASTSTTVKGEVGGASRVACILPFSLPDCIFDGRSDSALNLTDLKLQPATGDNIGWGNPWGSPTPSWVESELADGCAGGELSIGDPLYLGNGAEQSALTSVASYLDKSSTSWSTSKWGALPTQMTGSALPASSYGRTLEGVVPLFKAGPEYCDAVAGNESWNGSSGATVSGFAWGAVYDVKVKGSTTERNIKMRLELLSDYKFGLETGGPDHGVTAESPDVIVY